MYFILCNKFVIICIILMSINSIFSGTHIVADGVHKKVLGGVRTL